MKTYREILREVCGYSEADELETSDDITVEEAIEANEIYCRQYWMSSRCE